MKIAKYKGVNKIKNSSEKVDWIIRRIQEKHFRCHHTLRYFKIVSCFIQIYHLPHQDILFLNSGKNGYNYA